MKEVLCLATGLTYDMVISYGITAHPAVSPYPRTEPLYLIPIKKGGALEVIYNIECIIECYPDDIINYKNSLNPNQYKRLLDYHEQRKKSFGYGRPDTKYRFYMISRNADIKQPFYKKNIQVCTYLNLSDIPIV